MRCARRNAPALFQMFGGEEARPAWRTRGGEASRAVGVEARPTGRGSGGTKPDVFMEEKGKGSKI